MIANRRVCFAGRGKDAEMAKSNPCLEERSRMTRFSKLAAVAAISLPTMMAIPGTVQAGKCKSCSGPQQPTDGCKKKEPSFKKQFKELCSPINCTKKNKAKKNKC